MNRTGKLKLNAGTTNDKRKTSSDRRRTNSDRRKTNSGDKLTSRSVRRLDSVNNSRVSISSDRPRTNSDRTTSCSDDRATSSDALSSCGKIRRNKMVAVLISNDRLTNRGVLRTSSAGRRIRVIRINGGHNGKGVNLMNNVA